MIEVPLTPELAAEIEETFDNTDISLIKNIIFFDSWSDWEEYGVLLVFRAINDTIQVVEGGYSVMVGKDYRKFELQEVWDYEAEKLIEDFKEVC